MTIDANGFKAESFTEILTRLSNGFKNIYGQDINLDQDSPDGQQLGIQANIISHFLRYNYGLRAEKSISAEISSI